MVLGPSYGDTLHRTPQGHLRPLSTLTERLADSDVAFGSFASDAIGTIGRPMSALAPKADIVCVHSHRELFANAAIAASRVAA
jgi:hypothetical protein